MIKQPDGALRASPFYVRFGNAQSFLRGRDAKVVTVTVNGTLRDLTMRLGSNGEAYFADGTDDFDEEEEETEIESGFAREMDANDVGAAEALSVLRLDETPTKRAAATATTSQRDAGEHDVGKRATDDEITRAMGAIQSVGMTVLPSV